MTPWRLLRDDRRIWLLNDRLCSLVHFSRCYEFIPTDIDLAEAKLLRVIGQFLRQRVFKNGTLAHLGCPLGLCGGVHLLAFEEERWVGVDGAPFVLLPRLLSLLKGSISLRCLVGWRWVEVNQRVTTLD